MRHYQIIYIKSIKYRCIRFPEKAFLHRLRPEYRYLNAVTWHCRVAWIYLNMLTFIAAMMFPGWMMDREVEALTDLLDLSLPSRTNGMHWTLNRNSMARECCFSYGNSILIMIDLIMIDSAMKIESNTSKSKATRVSKLIINSELLVVTVGWITVSHHCYMRI